MSISEYRSRETTRDGEPLYLLEAPAKDDEGRPTFNGQRYKIQFKNGKGKTKHWKKAFDLHEQFGFIVTLPVTEDDSFYTDEKGRERPCIERWNIAYKPRGSVAEPVPEEDVYDFEEEELDPDVELYDEED